MSFSPLFSTQIPELWGKLAESQCFICWIGRTLGKHNECATWDLSILRHTGFKNQDYIVCHSTETGLPRV